MWEVIPGRMGGGDAEVREGSQSEVSVSPRWAAGTQSHWGHLGDYVELPQSCPTQGPRRLGSVSINS